MDRHIDISTFKGNPVTLLGNHLMVGDSAPEFHALKTDLTLFKSNDIKGEIRLISIIPSIDTGVCDLQTRKFNEVAAAFKEVTFISISCDLPFAVHRYCGTAGIQNIITLSDHKETCFGLQYGFLIEELRLLNRGIVIINRNNTIAYIEYVTENTNHPDYDKALNVLKEIV